MASITGARTTTNVLSDQLAIDLGNSISLLEPSVQPLAVFSRKASKKATVASKFSWLEDTSKPRYDTTGGTATTTATTVTVSHGTYWAQHDQGLNSRTGEQFRVEGVSGNVLTITRGIGGTIGTGVAMNNGDELIIIGTAQPENDTSKPARSDNPSKATNNTQIFRTPFEQSGTLQASSFQVNPSDWAHQSNKAGIEHAKDIEYAFLLGKKSADTSGATERRTTGGALSFVSTNQTDAGGDLSEAEWNAALLSGLRYSQGRNVIVFGSGVGVSALNKFPASKQMTTNNESTYGMDVTRFNSPFGSINLVYHPLLEGLKYSGYLIGIDMSEVSYRYLANGDVSRDTKLLTNRQPNDQDGRKDEYLSEVGLEFGQEKRHFLISGVTS